MHQYSSQEKPKAILDIENIWEYNPHVYEDNYALS